MQAQSNSGSLEPPAAGTQGRKFQAKTPATQAFGAEAFEASGTTTLRWLGMAGFLINSRGTTMMIDPLMRGFDMPIMMVQSRMFQVDPAARSRLNTAYVTNNFIWGAIGSGPAGLLWTHGGWIAITIAGAVLSAFALTVWLVGCRGALAPATRVTV